MRMKNFKLISTITFFSVFTYTENTCSTPLNACTVQQTFAAIVQKAGFSCPCKQAQADLRRQKDAFKASFLQRKLQLKKQMPTNYRQLKMALKQEKKWMKDCYQQAKKQIAQKKYAFKG